MRSPPLRESTGDLLVAKEEAAEQAYRVSFVDRFGVAYEAQGCHVGGGVVVLGEVAGGYGGADPAFPLGRREFAGEDFREHALAGAVGADDADALAAGDGQVGPDQDGLVPEGDGQVAKLHDLLAATDALAEAQADPAPFQDRLLDLVHAFDLLALYSRLPRVALVLGDVRPLLEALDRRLQPGYLFLLGDVQLLLALLLQLPRQGVG